MKKLTIALATMVGCSHAPPPPEPTSQPVATTTVASAPAPAPVAETNPLFTESTLPFEYPPFDKLTDELYAPAFDRGMREQLAEVEVIATRADAPTFDNTLVALERSGQLLDRALTVFYALVAADTNPAREKLQAEYAPKLSAHRDAINLDARLFARISALYEQRAALGLDAEGLRLVEKYYTDFVRAGAKLGEADKTKLKALNAELASLGTKFSQNVLAEVNDSAVVVDSAAALAGLSEGQITAAAEAAKARKLEGKWVLALQNTTGQPPNTNLVDRALRQKIHQASVARGTRKNERDNTTVVARMARLRAERAVLLGYPTHAAYVLEDATARTPAAVNARLAELTPAAVANARREGRDIEAMLKKDVKGAKLEPWDWAYYAEKVRQQKYSFDESQLKPYLELDRVLNDGVFFAAGKLYGLTFKERKDLPVYHPDVRVWDVFEADGTQLAIFIGDFYARPSKRGGAWMNAYVSQSTLLGDRPVVANHLNIPKPSAGQPTLMSWDEVTTMFHEFGHALHGMFSSVRYPYFSGTSVPRDFVEYPSQVNEMWAAWPEVLENYAKHHQTGEAMPRALVQKVLDSEKFNQGFTTTEYLAATLIDQRWHQLTPEQVPPPEQVEAFEAAALKQSGADYAPVPPRYRSTYFSHSWGGYSAGYYSYIWSEVLDADSVEWFKESGGLTRKNGDWFRAKLLSRGGSADAMQLFREFRGRDADIKPLLVRRGLTATPTKKK
jgi:peptidyl-dipeptidase Dcp